MSPLLLLALAGCGGGPYGAPDGSTVELSGLLPAMVYDVGFAAPADGYGALVRMAAFVTVPSASHGGTMPGNDIKVDVTSGWSGAYLIPEGAVEVVDGYEEDCNSSGGVDDPENPCSAWFDDQSQQYIEFSGDYVDVGEFQPTYLAGGTDSRGYLYFYLFIDSVPIDADGAAVAFSVYASIGNSEADQTISFD